MTFIQAIILGAIQGITEFLPISSSAHLVLTPWLFDWNYEGLGFDTALHFGTSVAIVAFFWRDWLSIFARAFSRQLPVVSGQADNQKLITDNNKFYYPQNLLWQIIIASIPAAIAGYLLSDYVETYLHSPILLAINLAIFGIILWLVDVWRNHKSPHYAKAPRGRQNANHKQMSNQKSENNNIAMSESASDSNLTISKIGYKQSLTVGLAQCLALIPGVSRSGITITAARSLGLSRENAARFSFLLSTPATVGAFLFEARKVDWMQTPAPFWVAIIVTIIVGLLTIKYLLKYLQRGSFLVFTVYRVILAIIIIAVFLLR